MRLVVAFAWAAVALTGSGAVRAHGLFPEGEQIAIDPNDPQHLVLRTTYGIVQSTDAGSSWSWICEQAAGYSGMSHPELAIAADGSVLLGKYSGLRRGTQGGCSWLPAAGPVDDQYTIIDLAIDQRSPTRAIALTSSGTGPSPAVAIAETLDSGKTWIEVGTELPPSFRATTIALAPSRPERVYVSGTASDSLAVLQRSDDGGEHWETLPFELDEQALVYLAAVDPFNPDRVYARAATAGTDLALVSDDGAKTWTAISELLPVRALALSPDGKKIAMGGPDRGLEIASADDLSFEKVSAVRVKCLTWHADGLFACADEIKDGMTLGVSKDEGRTFTALHRMAELTPLACAPDTTAAGTCPAVWSMVAPMVGIEVEPVEKPPSAPANEESDSSCGITTRAPSGSGIERALLALAVLGAAARRKRKPRTAPSQR